MTKRQELIEILNAYSMKYGASPKHWDNAKGHKLKFIKTIMDWSKK